VAKQRRGRRRGQSHGRGYGRNHQAKPNIPVPEGIVTATIEKLGHDGRGIARINGKTTFIDGALAGESVEFIYRRCHSRYDEAEVVQILEPASERVAPPCEYAATCGGCSLQHLQPSEQIAHKQSVLIEQLAHFGNQQPALIVDPIVGDTLGYRCKARLSVKHVPNQSCVVGFREKSSSRVVNIKHCPVLAPKLAGLIPEIQQLVNGLSDGSAISHIDLVQGDETAAITFRHIKPLRDADFQALLLFSQQHLVDLYLQPGGNDLVHQVWPEHGNERLSYKFDAFDVKMQFHPSDFIQVNANNNRKMVKRVIELLELDRKDRVLDLFCGIGNFTLPIAKTAGSVVGVEGNDLMVTRGKENACYNHLSNVEFYGSDLTKDLTDKPWARAGFNKVLIDPPRAGALDILKNITSLSPEKIVYVSCNPATLARDSGKLSDLGYQMMEVGAVDMFPHTTHVESIALFEPIKKSRK